MVDETFEDAHRREQAEAAVAQAVEVLRRHSSNYLIFVRTGKDSQAFKISAKTCMESVTLCSVAAEHLNRFVTDVAISAAMAADDYIDEEGKEGR